jgi:hypothetical protein
MSANNSIASSVTDGDPDNIEDLSDSLEQLICRASQQIAKRVNEMVQESTERLVTRRDGTERYIPVPNAALYGSAPDGEGIAMIRSQVREILMEDLYLKIMMPK